MARNWSRTEVEATVADYFDMLYHELSGSPPKKSEHRRRLAALLDDRTNAAIERKHQNISAILIELGFPYIDGYKPLGNYQQLLFESVSDRLTVSTALNALVRRQVLAPASSPTVDDILASLVNLPVASSMEQIQVNPGPPPVRRGIDYLAMEANNRSLGQEGEKFVVSFEQARLIHAGQERLAAKVEHVSETRGDGLGYDVLSFDSSGRERLIEVKTTAFGESTPFFVTRNEVAVSHDASEQFHLYRAFNFRKQPRLFSRQGPIDKSFRLAASQFLATIV
jgi:hypothetical protein